MRQTKQVQFCRGELQSQDRERSHPLALLIMVGIFSLALLTELGIGKVVTISMAEEGLDHYYLAETLTPIIKEVKRRRQLIFATHDANIVINGDSELIVIVGLEEGVITPISTTIENTAHREKLIRILEGGRHAFDLRSRRYGPSPIA